MAGHASPIGPDGDVIPHDHPDLVNGNRMIRRISEDHLVTDENRSTTRISSALFKCDPRLGYLSFDAEKCITDAGKDPAEYVQSPVWHGALIISVDQFRSFNRATTAAETWKIGMVPLDDNPCHGGVWGKITKGQSNDLQRTSEWLVPIPGVTKLSPA